MTRPPTVLDRAGLDALVEALIADGYRVVGPTVRDDAIVLAELDSGAQLPAGWGVDVGPGRYRLRRRADAAVFAHSAGPQSWKQFLHPPRERLFSSENGAGFEPDVAQPVRYAFLGVRGCDLAAVATLGTVLGGTASFAQRRTGLLVVAAGCTEPGGVCFCTSMGTGPAPGPGYDLSLTERTDAEGHRFLVDVGTDEGARVLASVVSRVATDVDVDDARTAVADAADRMGREMPAVDLRALLRDSRDSPRWHDVAQRCLTCANCTMVCPTCFCSTVEEVTDLTGDHTERWRRWDSCFTAAHSYIHGGSVRPTTLSRYRQWMTHKLATWIDQFETSGCVGCGRCITWCPVGIDITEEVRAIQETDRGKGH
jgi:ferredoxin